MKQKYEPNRGAERPLHLQHYNNIAKREEKKSVRALGVNVRAEPVLDAPGGAVEVPELETPEVGTRGTVPEIGTEPEPETPDTEIVVPGVDALPETPDAVTVAKPDDVGAELPDCGLYDES